MSLIESPQNINTLLDRYLEISNYYHSEMKRNAGDVNNIQNRLTNLISSLETIDFTDDVRIEIITETNNLGQNIIPTIETLDALEKYRNDILERLKNPKIQVPRNIEILKKWLSRDVLNIGSSFSSFTLAWDKLVEVSRLTLVPDPIILKVRDNVYMATIEFERYIKLLLNLLEIMSEANEITSILQMLKTTLADSEINQLDPLFQKKLLRAIDICISPDRVIEESTNNLTPKQIINEALICIDILAIVGLELGFFYWINSNSGAVHRKNVIKSLIYFSKILLAEGSWRKADEFATFAIFLTTISNRRCNLPDDEGIAMFKCNRYWARYKLGDISIVEELNAWDMSKIHPRYTFLKFVLLRKYDDACRILEELLPNVKSGSVGNISKYEVSEWPILEDFRQSEQYDKLKKRLNLE